MTTLSDQRTIGEIAAEWPATARIFQKHNIDYCCGGKFSLAEACHGRGISPDALRAELEQAMSPTATSERDWNAAPLGELIQHILDAHHEYLKRELPRLDIMIAKVAQAHVEKHGDVVTPLARTFAGLKDELEIHMTKEEMILFPLIRGLEEGQAATHCGSVANPIRVMHMEHDNAGHALERMRALTGNYALPADACNTYRATYFGLQELEADLHQHIHLENNILFPRALQREAA